MGLVPGLSSACIRSMLHVFIISWNRNLGDELGNADEDGGYTRLVNWILLLPKDHMIPILHQLSVRGLIFLEYFYLLWCGWNGREIVAELLHGKARESKDEVEYIGRSLK